MRCSRKQPPCPTAVAALAASLILIAVGCDQPQRSAKIVPVTGRVFLADEPLGFGAVTFQPVSGQPAVGQIRPDGRFELTTISPGDGAAVGKHRVRVTAYASQDPSSDLPAGGDSLGEMMIPARYASFATSGMEAIVVESGNGPFILRLEPDPPEEPQEMAPEAEGEGEGEGNAKGGAQPRAEDQETLPTSQGEEGAAESPPRSPAGE